VVNDQQAVEMIGFVFDDPRPETSHWVLLFLAARVVAGGHDVGGTSDFDFDARQAETAFGGGGLAGRSWSVGFTRQRDRPSISGTKRR
jgi:hypothetical protein